MSLKKTEEIFTPGTQPVVTYNSRQEEELEKKLKKLIRVKGKIGVISGKSKVGKTVLVEKILDDSKRITIQSGDLESNDFNLAELFAKKIKMPETVTKEIEKESDTNEYKASVNTSVSAKAKSFWVDFKASVQASASGETLEEKSTMVESIIKSNLFDEVIKYMIQKEIVVVFEDFHYVETEKQKKIIHDLKEPLRQKLTILIILIPRQKDLVLSLEPDMRGRVKTIDVPAWNTDELKFIATTGFDNLNIEVSELYINSFVENSFQNPQLMQEICSEFCCENDIEEEQSELLILNYDENSSKDKLNEFYSEIESGEESTVEHLKRGLRSSGRKKYELKNGEFKDVYEIIVDLIGEKAHYDFIEWNHIYSGVKSKIKNEMEIQQVQITNTLAYITKISKEMNRNEPPIVYENKKISMENAMLSYALRWSK